MKTLNEFVTSINTDNSGHSSTRYVGVIKFVLNELIISTLTSAKTSQGFPYNFSKPLNSLEWSNNYKGNDFAFILSTVEDEDRLGEIIDAIEEVISPTLSEEILNVVDVLKPSFTITDNLNEYISVHRLSEEDDYEESNKIPDPGSSNIRANIVPVNSTTTYFLVCSEDEDSITEWQSELITALPTVMSSIAQIDIMTESEWQESINANDSSSMIRNLGMDNTEYGNY